MDASFAVPIMMKERKKHAPYNDSKTCTKIIHYHDRETSPAATTGGRERRSLYVAFTGGGGFRARTGHGRREQSDEDRLVFY
jgi:hypothetical protein